jgi:hypothetical protein
MRDEMNCRLLRGLDERASKFWLMQGEKKRTEAGERAERDTDGNPDYQSTPRETRGKQNHQKAHAPARVVGLTNHRLKHL